MFIFFPMLYAMTLVFGYRSAFFLRYHASLSEFPSLAGLIYFIIPLLLALLQILLLHIVFKSDTPKQLFLNSMEDCAMYELKRIYSSDSKRMEEYNKLQETSNQLKLQYPTYLELFSKKYLLSMLKVGALLLLRVPFELFDCSFVFVQELNSDFIFYILYYSFIAIILGGFILFFFAKSIF